MDFIPSFPYIQIKMNADEICWFLCFLGFCEMAIFDK